MKLSCLFVVNSERASYFSKILDMMARSSCFEGKVNAQQMRRNLQIDYEWVVDLREEALFQLDMVNLLKRNDLCLLQGLEGHRLIIEQGQVDLPECARANHSQQVIVRDAPLRALYLPTHYLCHIRRRH